MSTNAMNAGREKEAEHNSSVAVDLERSLRWDDKRATEYLMSLTEGAAVHHVTGALAAVVCIGPVHIASKRPMRLIIKMESALGPDFDHLKQPKN
jgi:hypothetical protein